MTVDAPETNDEQPASLAGNQDTVQADPVSDSFNWEALTFVFLLLIVALAAYFRFTGLNWDENYHLHPDERFLTDLASLLQPTSDPLTYLRTSESPLNPYNVGRGFYVYGNFPMTITRLIAEWVTRVCGNFSELCQHTYNSYDGVHLVGRALSGLVDLVTVVFVFLIGRRLYDWRAGLLAALLQASAVMPIQQAHFFTMDNWAAALTTLALYTAVRAAGLGDAPPRWQQRWWFLFGLTLGLAVASRINIAPLALVINLSAVIWLVRRGHTWQTLRYQPMAILDSQRVILGIALAAIVSVITFRLAQPYAFSDSQIIRQEAVLQTGEEPGLLSVAVRSLFSFNPQWRANMEEIQRLQTPEASFPPALQWTNRTPIIFPLTNMVIYGMGLTAGIAAWLALLWALWRIVRAHPSWVAHAIPVFWSSAYFLFMGTRWVKSVRYFLPVYPTLFLLAGWGLFALWQRVQHRTRRTAWRITVIALFVAVIAPSVLWANAFISIYQQPITRVAASHWMFEHIPSGATILYQVDGQPRQLQLPLKQFEFFPGAPPLTINFTLPEDSLITAARFNYLSAANVEQPPATMAVNIDQYAPAAIQLDLDSQRRAVLFDLPDISVSADSLHFLTAELLPGSGPIRADTSHLIVEHWDDVIPVSIDGRNGLGSYYATVTNDQVPVTHPDSPEKRHQVVGWLAEADFVVLSSQRAIWHLPRLPLTYPLMIRYYQGLFAGELGFDLVAQFHADFHIGPLYISDTSGQLGWGAPAKPGWPPPGELGAEEAFSVYDHPPVWIFGKNRSYSDDRVINALAEVDLSQTVIMTPGEATQAPNGLLLADDVLAQQQAGGTFSQIFNLDNILNRSPALAAAIWWLSVVLLGWLAFPLTFVVIPGLPDRGYGLARILALLIISYFTWMMASLGLLPHTRSTLSLGMLLLGLVSTFVFVRRRVQIARFVRQNLAYIGIAELVGLLLYLLLIGVRLGNPDVWDVIWGGEKPMDLAYFTAVLKSTSFPPYDPWYAGGYINYYYYGFVYVGALTKLLGIIPALAYNLILPMLFSFTGLGVFSVTYNLVARSDRSDPSPGHGLMAALNKKAVTAGLIAACMAMVLGNLAEVGVLLDAWYRTGTEIISTGIAGLDVLARILDGGIRILTGQPTAIGTGDWFWNATRAININPGEVIPITEFPFFTFLYGDLHAHMISQPMMMLALGWAIGMALPRQLINLDNDDAWWETGLQWLVGAIAIGVLRATNTWDWPTYLVIGGLAVAYHVFQRRRRLDWSTLGEAALLISFLVGASILAFWPYARNYGVGYTSFKLWPGSYTYLGNYLSIHGLFLFFILTHLAREFRAWTRTWTPADLAKLQPAAGLVLLILFTYVILILLLMIKGYWIAPVVLTLVLVAGLLGLRPGLPPNRRIVLVLISAALSLTLFVELFVLDGDIGRMNTVFKFYVQVWLIMSVTAGAAATWAWPAIRRRRRLSQFWLSSLALMVMAAALYPLLATKAKWDIRMSDAAPHTLNGMAFMPYVEYGDSGQTVSLQPDYEAIQWIYRHIEGSPVIAEAHSNNPYRSIGNRIAVYTGLPAIVGWDWHQRQQRAVLPGSLVSSRIQDVNRLFSTPAIPEAQALIRKYDVAYIYAGELERLYYGSENLEKFDRMVELGALEAVYQKENTTIYRVIDG